MASKAKVTSKVAKDYQSMVDARIPTVELNPGSLREELMLQLMEVN